MPDRFGLSGRAPYAPPDFVAAEIDRRTHGRHLLLLTDFDGTLAELAPTPDEAVISDAARTQMADIESLPSVTVGVVSGRRLADVRMRVGPGAAYVAGLHGFEIEGPTASFRHHQLDATAPVIASLLVAARQALADCPGVILEDKIYALTCHVRLAPAECADRALQEFAALADPQVEAGILKTLVARRALELLPAADWHKGRAAEWIRARVGHETNEPVSIVYLGDDRTDEDAFAVLGDVDVAIGVGSRPHEHLIDWRLEGPSSIGHLLHCLADIRRERV